MYLKVFFINFLEEEAFLQRHQSETITVYINKRLKEESLNLITAVPYNTFITKIMTNNILSGHIRFLGTPYYL